MTNVSIEPGDAGSLADLIADTDDGLYLETNRSWSIDDRRLQFQFATEVAPRDPRRRARPAVPQPLLRRGHAAVLGLARRRVLARRMAAVGADELRQGRARPGHARLARRRARRASATSRSAWRERVETPLELAERALAPAPAARRRSPSTRERSLLSRFARSRADPGDRGRRPDGRASLCAARRPRRRRRRPTAPTTTRCARAARRPRDGRRGRRARPAGRATYPGLPAPPAATAATTAGTRRPPRSTPAPAGAALRAAFAAAAEHGLEAFGIWTAGEVRDGDRLDAPASRAARPRHRRHMKVICRDARRPQRAAPRRPASALAALDPAAIARRAAREGRAAGSPVELAPGEYPVVLERRRGRRAAGVRSAALRVQRAGPRRGPRRAGRAARARAWPRRRSTSPTRRASRARCRARFDAEGVPKAPLPLIQDGVAHARRARHALGRARRRRRALDRPRARARRLARGPDPDQPRAGRRRRGRRGASSCAPIERGIYVTRLWYVNIVHAKRDAADRHDARRHVPDRGRPRSPGPLRDVRFTDAVAAHPRRAPRR